MNAGDDAVAEQKNRRRGAVIGAQARVFLDAPPELRKYKHQNGTVGSVLIHVFDESAQRIASFFQQVGVGIRLTAMRIETTKLGKVH